MTVQAQHNLRKYSLGKRIGGGGEGEIFQLVEDASSVAKIFTRPAGTALKDKLDHMVRNPPNDVSGGSGHVSIAWPKEILESPNGQTIGYVMPRIDEARTVFEVFNKQKRKMLGLVIPDGYFLAIGRNIASAVDSIHSAGYIIGDVNNENILVHNNTRITIIDTDSFQTYTNRHGQLRLHRCLVGRPDYTPPELQGNDFASVERNRHHDAFGLAVLIYQLVFEGNHPFRIQWLGVGEPPAQPEKIRLGMFPYATSLSGTIRPIPNIRFNEAFNPLQALFIRAFGNGHRSPTDRPAAREWAKVLDEALDRAQYCSRGHTFWSPQQYCGRCVSGIGDSVAIGGHLCTRCGSSLNILGKCQKCERSLDSRTTQSLKTGNSAQSSSVVSEKPSLLRRFMSFLFVRDGSGAQQTVPVVPARVPSQTTTASAPRALLSPAAGTTTPSQAFVPSPSTNASTPIPVSIQTGGLIGNPFSMKVHTITCIYGIKASSKIHFASLAEARRMNYKPCKICKPR